MPELIIECTEAAQKVYEDFCKQHGEYAYVETVKSADGLSLLNLVIEKLPEIISATAALIAVLKGQKLSFRILENGKLMPKEKVEELIKGIR